MAEKERSGSFWTTLPGILTALAALLGAIGSLIGVLASLDDDPAAPPAPNSTVAEETPREETAAPDELAASRIAFLSDRTGDCDVHLVNADGSGEEPLTDNAAIDLRPDWSPTGQHLAFASKQDGDFDIYIVDVATGQQRAVLDTETDEKGPTWSPDGQQLAFSSTRDGAEEIWAIAAIGGAEPVQLTDVNRKSVSPDWSPDNDAVAFASNADGDFDIYVMDRDGSDVRNLTGELFETRSDEFDPSWSSDGEMISFDGRREIQAFDIYVVDPDGSDLVNLTAHSANDRRSSWAPDDSRIVFGSDRLVPADDTQRGCSVDTRQMDLFTVNADGNSPQRLLRNEADDSSPAWGPLP